MKIRSIQNLIRQAAHFDFNSQTYFYYFDKLDTEEFDIIKDAFWSRNPDDNLSDTDINLLVTVLANRWNRLRHDSIKRDCYLVIRAKIDRFFVEIAKVLANDGKHELARKKYYDFLMPTLKNSINYPATEAFRSHLTISEDGCFLISVEELKKRKDATYSQSELFLIERWEWFESKAEKKSQQEVKIEMDISSTSVTDSKDAPQDSVHVSIESMLSHMAEIGRNSSNSSQAKIEQQLYFNQAIKKLNLEQLTALSDFMNAVQLKQVDALKSKFDLIRKGRIGYGNTSTWREMRHAVKSLIVEVLLEKYKNLTDGNGKINLPEEIYNKYADLLSQNTHHKYNYFKYPDTYIVFIKYFQCNKELKQVIG